MKLQTLVFLFLPVTLCAQADPPRFELGPLFTCLTGCDHSNRGFGGRATVNITKFVGAEFQLSRLGAQTPFVGAPIYGNGQGKFTLRLEDQLKFNLFAIAGPGFFRDDRFVGKAPGAVSQQRVSSFAFNFGGGFEVVPVRFASARFDFANLSSRTACLDAFCDQIDYRNDFDFKFAVMFRLH